MTDSLQDMTAHEIMLQSSETSKHYMFKAIESIDQKFGDGYAKKHPNLIGAFMQTSAIDFLTSMISKKG